MRDITPRKPPKQLAKQPTKAPDIETPPPAFTYDPLSSGPALNTQPEPELGQPSTHIAPLPKSSRHKLFGGKRKVAGRKPYEGANQTTKPKGKLKRHWWKWLLGLLVLGGIAVFALLSVQVTRITSNPFSWGKLKGEADGRVNILLLGVGDPGHAGEDLADTNMVISLDTKNDKVAMISIPRDLRVKIPGYGSQKINNAHAEGDIPLAIKTVEQTLDIPIHYYVRANFSGLKQAVDAVGGVDINVTDRLYDPEYPCDKNESRSCGFKLNPGQIHMDGALALRYARCRKGTCGDDFGRALRQQQVLQAVRTKAMSLDTLANPAKLNALLGSAANNIKTDLSINNMMRLNDFSKKLSDGSTINVVFSLKPNGFLISDPGGTSDLLPAGGSFSSIQNFVANVFTLGPMWKEEPTVIIENGTTTIGVAKTLSNTINKGIYSDLMDIIALTNATTKDYATSQIIDYTGGKKPATAAYLQSLVGVAPTPPPATTTGKAAVAPADFVVILGSDYVAKTAPSTSTTTPKR